MSTNRTTKRVVLAVGAVLLMALLFAAAAFAVDDTSASPKADLLIMQAPDVLHASPGQLVKFTSYAANNGPSTTQLDAIVEGKVNLSVKHQRCQVPPVSPDGPFCEFGTDVVKVVLSMAKALPAARAAMTIASISATMMRLITHPLSK